LNSGEKLGALLGPFKGNYFAKAGLDLAWWDAYAKSLGEPLWKTIGGKNNRVTVGADISVMEDLNALIECIGKSVDAGFKRVKLKFRPGWGLKMVAAVRQEFPDTVFHVDCNSGFRLDDLEMFKELDRYDLAMIEQPLAFDDLADHARLQMQIDTPICLDESIISLDRARKAIQINACKWVNLKVGRVGGLTNALAIHNYCLDHGIPCWVGGMLEFRATCFPAPDFTRLIWRNRKSSLPSHRSSRPRKRQGTVTCLMPIGWKRSRFEKQPFTRREIPRRPLWEYREVDCLDLHKQCDCEPYDVAASIAAFPINISQSPAITG
jgi:hypothetical protein